MQEKIKYNFSNDPTGIHMLILGEVDKSSKVLDIGCASGYMGEYLSKEKNCDVFGIEPNFKSFEIAKDKGYKIILNKNIEEALKGEELKNEKFDYIILADVLEHVVSPEKVLDGIKRFLKDDGRIIISLPNVAHYSVRLSLFFGKFDMKETGVMDKTHLHFYTLKSAKKLLENFEIEKIRPRGDLERWFGKFYLGFVGKKILFLFKKFFAVQFIFLIKK